MAGPTSSACKRGSCTRRNSATACSISCPSCCGCRWPIDCASMASGPEGDIPGGIIPAPAGAGGGDDRPGIISGIGLPHAARSALGRFRCGDGTADGGGALGDLHALHSCSPLRVVRQNRTGLAGVGRPTKPVLSVSATRGMPPPGSAVESVRFVHRFNRYHRRGHSFKPARSRGGEPATRRRPRRPRDDAVSRHRRTRAQSVSDALTAGRW